MTSPARRPLLRAAVTALLLTVVTCAVVIGSSPSSNASISLSPAATTMHIRTGGHAAVGVRVNFTGAQGHVLRVIDPPRGIRSRITTAPQPYGAYDVVDFAAALATRPGTYRVTIAGSAGTAAVRFTVALVVSPHGSFTLRLAPPQRSAVVGGAVNYSITLEGFQPKAGRTVSLTVHGFPPHSLVSLSSPTLTVGTFVTLHVVFPATVLPGTYMFMVQGRAGSELETSYGYLVLRVKPPTRPGQVRPPFTITGNPSDPLSPGSASPINLSITNAENTTMSVDSLTVSVTGTTTPGCTPANFAVVQYSGIVPLQIPANSTRSLQQLGIPVANWPRVGMLDLPVNQDTCKSVTIHLGYTGTGSGL